MPDNLELHVKTVKYFKSIERVQEEVEARTAEIRRVHGKAVNGPTISANASTSGGDPGIVAEVGGGGPGAQVGSME